MLDSTPVAFGAEEHFYFGSNISQNGVSPLQKQDFLFL